MSHPLRYDPSDPLYRRVRELAMALPEVDEKLSHGHPAFHTTKVFCYYGSNLKVDGEWVAHDQSIVVKVPPAEHPALLAEPRCYLPFYWGSRGWVGVDLDAATDWTEVAELLEESFRLTATAKAINALEQPGR